MMVFARPMIAVMFGVALATGVPSAHASCGDDPVPCVIYFNNPNTCVGAKMNCSFSCRAGDLITVDVYGHDYTNGTATCGDGRAPCFANTNHCNGSGRNTGSGGSGSCDLAHGELIICQAS